MYTGSRNGSITRFDMRLDDLRGQKLLEDVFMAHSNSITHLNIVRDSQLIVSNMDGSVSSPLWVLHSSNTNDVPFIAWHVRPAICTRIYPPVNLHRAR